MSHSLAEEERSLFELAVARKFRGWCCLADPFFTGRESFSLSAAVSARSLPAVTEAREKLSGILLFQYFSGTLHSFSWTCWNNVT